LSGLKAQIMELEPQIQSGRQELALMQTKLSTEQLARQKAEVTREAERASQESEIASLSMKIEGLVAHLGTTEKIAANLRDQYRDKAEALRLTEKTLKDALADRAVSERRLEVAQEASARHLAQAGEAQRALSELKDRSEMLAKALGAKEAQLDGSARKVASLTSRIDQINARFEQERAGFEAANRRLIEELQSEKAERSLAQGALDIARTSRAKLLTQYTALKRQQSLGGLRPLDLGPEDEVRPRPEATDNVRVFKTGEMSD
jgi:crescentin